MSAELLEPLHQVVPRGLVIDHWIRALHEAPFQKIASHEECVCAVDIAANQLIIFPLSEFGKRSKACSLVIAEIPSVSGIIRNTPLHRRGEFRVVFGDDNSRRYRVD